MVTKQNDFGIELIDSSEKSQKQQIEELKQRLEREEYESMLFKNQVKRFIFSRKPIILAIWGLMYKYFISIEFGMAFLILSMITFIFMNLGERQKGTLSAYSVFNKNFEKLPGTFDSSHVDQAFGGYQNQNEDDSNVQRRNNNNNQEQLQKGVAGAKSILQKNISKIGNLPCSCGSEKKYKKCCYLVELQEARQGSQQNGNKYN